MATRRRKRSSKRRVVRARAHNPINPTRRRKRTTTRRRRHSVFARSRRNPINPVRRRRRIGGRRRHHRNPLHAAGGEILNYTVAGLAQGIAGPIVGGFAGKYLPFGAYNAPIISAGTGWLLSKLFGFFGATRRFSHPALVFGFATAGMQVLQPIVSRTVGSALAPSTGMSGPYQRFYQRGMRGIGVVTGVPPTQVLPPPPPQNNQQGMNGMAMRPGVYGR